MLRPPRAVEPGPLRHAAALLRRQGCAEASRPRPRPAFTPSPDVQHEYDELVRFVPLALVHHYLAAGWVVKPMRGHHGRYSALASRWVMRGEDVTGAAPEGDPSS